MLGILLGGISGYFGGTIDLVIQRAIKLLPAIPRIPLWLTLSAALPRDWGTVEVYFGITIILSVLGWTGMARTVRGKFLALREEDFTQAAKYPGVGEMRVIIRDMYRRSAAMLTGRARGKVGQCPGAGCRSASRPSARCGSKAATTWTRRPTSND